MQYLKQSTTVTIQLGPFLDDTDGKTYEDGLTISSTDVYLSKNGAAFTNTSDTNAATHDRAGWYRKQLNGTDTAIAGRLIVSVHESGALPVWREFMVLPAYTFDAFVTGDTFRTNLIEIGNNSTALSNFLNDYDGDGYAKANSTIGTVTAVTNQVSANVTAVSGDATAADNLEKDYDGTGYAKNNSTIGTVTSNSDLVTAAAVRAEMDSNSTQLAAIIADTDELQSDDVPTLIAALPTAAENRAEMDSNSTQLAAIVADTDELQTDDIPGTLAALNDVSTAEVNAEVDTALTDIHLDHLLAADYDPASKPGVATALLNELVEDDSGVSRFTENALEQAPSGTGASAAAIADAVWEEAIVDHSGTSGSTAEALDGATAPTAAAVADQVWEETLADHSGTSGSTAEALSQIPGASKGAIEYIYTIDDGVDPIEGAEVWITTDSGGNNVIWSGVSDALGVARASDNEKPWLDAGTYYGWAQKTGYSFSNPDTLAVS